MKPTLLQRLACQFGFHDFVMVRPLSRQAALMVCRRCEGRWAYKAEGDYAGALMPWSKARHLYENPPFGHKCSRAGDTPSANLCSAPDRSEAKGTPSTEG